MFTSGPMSTVSALVMVDSPSTIPEIIGLVFRQGISWREGFCTSSVWYRAHVADGGERKQGSTAGTELRKPSHDPGFDQTDPGSNPSSGIHGYMT
jgi:hypothetical protein